MKHARSTRRTLPTPAGLSLNGPGAARDLDWLGWMNPESVDLLWALSGAGDPDLALNTLIRLMGALDAADGTPKGEMGASRRELDRQLREDIPLRVRLISLLGASTALGDHLVANPGLWYLLAKPAPDRAEMMHAMLGCVDATPAVFDLPDGAESDDAANGYLSAAGTYRARMTGREAEQELRRTYRTLLMRIAAHDLAGTYPESPRRVGQPEVPFTVVAGLLTDLADAALTAALAVAVGGVYDDRPLDTRISVMAMGKCGARELNYISDVDVIFIAEPAHSRATRLAGEFIRIGCRAFFEVDAALRPEGKHGALVRTLESHIAYYKRWAHTWEFQALLKARPMTGDRGLGHAYLDALNPMVWDASRRESFVDDVQAMRRRVIDNVPENLRDRELKLGRGGLRDVEFAVQLLQMVHGRSDETLRVTSTVDALGALMEAGYIGREDGQTLIGAYEFMRLLEHRLQLQRVRRTHTMPEPDDEAALRWLARTSGIRGSGHTSLPVAMLEEHRRVVRQISSLHAKLFYRPLLNSVVNLPVETLRLSAESARLQLAALRYKFPDRAYEHLQALASGGSRRAKIQAMLLPTLMEWLSTTADPDAGLLNYRKLSEAVTDRQWFLRMLRDEGIVGQRLMRILGNSPYVSDLILSTPDTVKRLGDGANGPKLLDTNPDTVSRSLVSAACRHSNPDKAIATARSLRRAELARVAAADLLGMMDVKEVCRSLSLVWDAVLEAALRVEVAAADADSGDGPLARIAVIGMGRLGGAELGYGSDADVMFVCEPTDGVSDSDAVKWSIGICDRLRRRLSKPSDDPPLEVDLGLRPEGRSGAIVRTIESYERYYGKWGETWEIQALLRATAIAGDPDVGKRFLTTIDRFRYPPEGISADTVREVRRMKARVDNERLPRGADRKTHTKLGRGALTDIEWTVQLLTMLHSHEVPELHNTSTLEVLDVIEDHDILDDVKVERLRTAWLTATRARNALVLVRGKRTDQLPPAGPQLAQVAGAAGWEPSRYQEFLEYYLKVTRRARQVVDEVFWGEPTFEP
ncbi:bifunctional [glutamine synthetase] adenylyltransferase/[glutamine synthetase]-adenylyl-L-tyrosine phosphorylase [Corynebacterium sp. P5875]|uniref:Bifunctional glutamine synthetase adenylyltransferase/adenylyl-removing enzyme n=1 Tax=Corynebacterium antarcticum TaxID=2800405 RepID=A0A9Q4CDI3_9CORY|nr:bifunctional [glutamine synthetase] adenylyltransferase/[glutamine synthetase]-adenylyl-L-tyrosine phosphorylase [Corynebacterium antarcticum]MCX7537484.1 bifunctional [glutamine synthetase] adenylyltransferase/[glutamine synthetase]-adenylyl-L-tyrosine phosphorylase [Corynebacterium antarcticum]